MSPERRLTSPHIEFNRLFSARVALAEKHGMLSKKQIRSEAAALNPFSENIPKSMAENPLIVVDLKNIKGDYIKRGEKISTPSLVANFIGEKMDLFLEAFAKESPQSVDFCATVDFGYGFRMAPNYIILAEHAIRGSLGKEARKIMKGQHAPEEEMAIAIESLSKYQNLLIQDNSGRSLVRAVVKNIEDGSVALPKYVAKELVLLGAKCTEKAYNIVYPIAERVNNRS